MKHYRAQLLACGFYTIDTFALQARYVLFFINLAMLTLRSDGWTTLYSCRQRIRKRLLDGEHGSVDTFQRMLDGSFSMGNGKPVMGDMAAVIVEINTVVIARTQEGQHHRHAVLRCLPVIRDLLIDPKIDRKTRAKVL
jgi:hypothetical protein